MGVSGSSFASVVHGAGRFPSAVLTSMASPVRAVIGTAARGAFGHPSAERHPFDLATDEDPGLFGPDSVTWRVHRDRSMLIGGLRALFLQSLHPLAIAGVAQHSAYRDDPLGRLARTGRFVGATTYGTTAAAEAAIAMVRRVHTKVRGTAADGRAYRADDPELLAWVHNVEVDSFLVAYRRYGTGLSDADADRYVGEMARLGCRLGATDVPTTAHELSRWIDAVPGIGMTDDARQVVRFLVLPTLPVAMLPTYGIIAAAAADLLSWRRRLTLGLWPVPLADPFIVRPAASTLLAVLGWALGPPPLPRGESFRSPD